MYRQITSMHTVQYHIRLYGEHRVPNWLSSIRDDNLIWMSDKCVGIIDRGFEIYSGAWQIF